MGIGKLSYKGHFEVKLKVPAYLKTLYSEQWLEK
jgi:hypothetical protein